MPSETMPPAPLPGPNGPIRARTGGLRMGERRVLLLLGDLAALSLALLGAIILRDRLPQSPGGRYVYARVFHHSSFVRHVLIVGAGRTGRAMAKALQWVGEAAGVQCFGLLDDDPALHDQEIHGYHVLGPSAQLEELVQRLHIEDVVVAITRPSTISQPLMQTLVRCLERGLAVVPMPLYYETITGAIPVQYIGQNIFALAGNYEMSLRGLWDALRRLLDIVLGFLGLVFLALLLPFLALAIYLDSKGPIFYHQERVGLGGVSFMLTKFRSMVPDAEAAGAVWAADGDPRITRVGRFLRRTRLDELPQVWNMLRGNMTLIGPRPERPEFVRRLDELLPYYAVRHSVKPGITGWAQVCYDYGNSVEDALMKLQYDLYYVKKRGPLLDAIIILRTVRVVLLMKGT
jgi:exopolysaccharide biosynthesis polyprenyl glycosylphosphotransferase